MAAMDCLFVRYMDDWVVLATTRWKLRRAIKAVNEEMAKLKVRQHPDKTFIGRISRGFNFLGWHYGAEGMEKIKAVVE